LESRKEKSSNLEDFRLADEVSFLVGFYEDGAIAMHVYGLDDKHRQYSIYVFGGELDGQSFDFSKEPEARELYDHIQSRKVIDIDKYPKPTKPDHAAA